MINLNKTVDQIEKLGPKKAAGYSLLAIGIFGGAYYVYNWIKRSSKTEEQNNASKNKIEEIETASNFKKQEIEQLHAHRKEEERLQTDQKIEVINAQKEADIEKMKLRNELRKERDAAKAVSTFVDGDGTDKIESYREAMRNGTVGKNVGKALGFPWVREGFDTGLVGPTDSGKSTFVMQIAIAIAKGKCDIKLAPEWHNIPPTSVLLFSLEQSYEEINTYYGSVINNLPMLEIYADSQITPKKIIDIIKEKKDIITSTGMAVFVDNYSKLEDKAGVKAMKQFCEELDDLRSQSLKVEKPITLFKVYHVKPDWNPTKPLTPASVRGDKKNVFFTNNFVYFTYCKHGSDKRVLGYMKLKHGNKETLSILEYAGTEIDQFRYVGKGSKEDLGEASTEQKSCDVKQTPGRKSEYCLDEIMVLYNMVQAKECTYAEIEASYGIKKSMIKKRIQRARKNTLT